MSEETVTFNLELNVEEAFSNVRKYETVLYRSIALAQRLGLPENVNQAIEKMQRMTMVARLLHSSLIRLETATPYGWVMALVSVAGVSLTTAEMTHEMMSEAQGH